MFKVHDEGILTNQMIQRRLSSMAIWIHAMTCSLSRLDQSIRNGIDAQQLKHDRAIVAHICAIGQHSVNESMRGLDVNTDDTMRAAADAAWSTLGSMPHSDYSIPEKTPVESARGQGRVTDQTFIKQFGSGSIADQIEQDVAQMEKDLA